MAPARLVGPRTHVECPCSIPRLQGWVGRGLDDLSLVEGRAGSVVDTGGHLQLGTDSDVAAILRGRTEDPGLCSNRNVAESAHLKNSRGRIDLVARSVVDGHVGDQAPAGSEAVFDADVKDVLMVFNRRWPGNFLRADEVLVGIEDAVADVDGEVVDFGGRHRTAGVAAVDQLVKSALIAAGCNASLCERGAAGERHTRNDKKLR